MKQTFNYVFNYYLQFQQSKIGLPYPYGIKQNTYATYINRGNIIKAYFNKNEIETLEQINVHTATNLLNTIIKNGNSVAYANKVITLLKTVLSYAREHLNVITHTLSTLKLHEAQRQKKYLRKGDLALIENYQFETKKMEYVKDLFLIQCYTGFAYIDLKAYRKKWISQNEDGAKYISYTRTKQEYSFAIVPVTPKLKILLEKHKHNLPIISNQKYNKYLKEMATLVGLDIYLTSHVARKTCGYLLINLGFSMESVSTVLGHADVKTTQKYYVEITQERVLMEYAKLTA